VQGADDALHSPLHNALTAHLDLPLDTLAGSRSDRWWSCSHFCTGVLITCQWVLTAAHCTPVIIPGQTQVRVGSLTRSSGGTLADVTRVIAHPAFSDPALGNDIALVQLAAPVCDTRPIPIAWTAGPTGTGTLTAGWGLTCQDSSQPKCGVLPERLQ
jgi:secreted trypsin-like serine protease